MKNWKVIAGVIGIFLLGMLAGGLVTAKLCQIRVRQVVLGGPQAVGDVIVRRLSWHLRLDGAQRDQLRAIVGDAQTEMKSVRRQVQPQVEEILERAETKVCSMLRPEQVERFDKLVSERKAKWGDSLPAPKAFGASSE